MVPSGYGDRFLSRIVLSVAANGGGARQAGCRDTAKKTSLPLARAPTHVVAPDPKNRVAFADTLIIRAFGSVVWDATGEEAAGEWRNGRA